MGEQAPSVGRIVHYVSYGTPGGEYLSTCRAAIITAVEAGQESSVLPQRVSLCVLNPEGMFFNQGVRYHDGAGKPADPDCPELHGPDFPFRYCACGWTEDHYAGGTWHWPERV